MHRLGISLRASASSSPLSLTPSPLLAESQERGGGGGEAAGGGVRSALSDLARRYGLIAIYSFGSRAGEIAARVAGEAAELTHPGSDVDIGVLPAPGRRLTAAERADLTVALEDLLGVSRVDMVVLPEAPPFLALDIVRGELLCTTDPVAEAEYQLYVLRRAADLAPFERQRRQMILAGEAY